MDMQRGQRDKLGKYINISEEFTVLVMIKGDSTCKFTCLGVDENETIVNYNYMVSAIKKETPNAEIRYSPLQNGAAFKVKLAALPKSINKLVFAVGLDGEGIMSDTENFMVRVGQNNQVAISMALTGSDFGNEKSIVLFEIYLKSDAWRFWAVVSGYKDNLSSLIKRYFPLTNNTKCEISSSQTENIEKSKNESAEPKVTTASLTKTEHIKADIGQNITQNNNNKEKFELSNEMPEKYEEMTPESWYCLGRVATTAGDKEKALRCYRKAAEQNYARAQYALGKCYYNGRGVEKIFSEAVKWYKKSAENGYRFAQYSLGKMYFEGDILEYNKTLALKWLKESAEQNCSDAEYLLGEIYFQMEGVSENSVYWLDKAAQHGNTEAQCVTGGIYVGIVPNTPPKFIKRAYGEKMLLRAAKSNYVEAQKMLGAFYLSEDFGRQSISQGVEWTKKAVINGDAEAKTILGSLYLQGKYVTKDYAKGRSLIEEAVADGNEKARNILRSINDRDTQISMLQQSSYSNPNDINLERSLSFDEMYDGVISRDFSSNTSARGKLINFGGKNKLREIMMNGELILAMSPAMNVKNGWATLVSDDVLVVTNRRLILLEKKIFGTVVSEVPIRVCINSLEWHNSNLYFATSRMRMNVYVDDSGIGKIKEALYNFS